MGPPCARSPARPPACPAATCRPTPRRPSPPLPAPRRPAPPRAAPQFRDLDNLFCRYTFAYGPDWRVLQGIDVGISQEAQKGGEGGGAGVVWNFPVDVTFKTTNPHGWPRLVLSVFNSDVFGRHVIRGYGSVLVPTVPGSYTRYVRTFAPASSTYLQAFLGWATGNLPSFYDSKFVARNEGREVVRVRSTGVVRVQLCVVSRRRRARGRARGRARAVAPPASRQPRSDARRSTQPQLPQATRGMASHGYTTGGPPDAPDLDVDAAFPPAAAAGGGMGGGGGGGGGRRASGLTLLSSSLSATAGPSSAAARTTLGPADAAGATRRAGAGAGAAGAAGGAADGRPPLAPSAGGAGERGEERPTIATGAGALLGEERDRGDRDRDGRERERERERERGGRSSFVRNVDDVAPGGDDRGRTSTRDDRDDRDAGRRDRSSERDRDYRGGDRDREERERYRGGERRESSRDTERERGRSRSSLAPVDGGSRGERKPTASLSPGR